MFFQYTLLHFPCTKKLQANIYIIHMLGIIAVATDLWGTRNYECNEMMKCNQRCTHAMIERHEVWKNEVDKVDHTCEAVDSWCGTWYCLNICAILCRIVLV